MAAPQAAAKLLPPLLLALAAPSATFWVRSWPRVAVVPFGGSVPINCSRGFCPGLAVPPELSWALGSTAGPGGRRWRTFVLTNITEWEPEPALCRAQCGDSSANSSTAIIVYKQPDWVHLDAVPAVPVGAAVTLRCHVAECAPLANLTVTLRRGTETLSTHSFPAAPGSAAVTVSHALTAGPGDHGQPVRCHAELSLRPHGPLFARAAAPIRLSVYALPDPPQLFSPPHLEADTAAASSCRVLGAFPVEETRVVLALDGDPLETEVTATAEAVMAVAQINARTVGHRELSCTAAVGAAEQTARALIHVYRFPAPTLELSPVPAGLPVSVWCRSAPADPPSVRLQLRDADGGVLAEGPQPALELRVVPQREDDGRWFGCSARLALGDDVVTKEAEGRLTVLYPPEMDSTSCPTSLTWLEGTRETLSCGAAGNPTPIVTCTHRGDPPSTAGPILVTRSHAGIYHCNATNSVGTRSRIVTVRVEYEPSLSELGCPAHRTWLEGQRWELPCSADGDPTPTTHCARHGRPPGDEDGRTVSRSDAGRYVCTATNRHGSARRSVDVTVEYQPSIGDADCPARRLWVEGTAAELECNASGNPPPSVACSKLGDPHPPPGSANVTRAHAGTYQCQATNVHGTALQNVTITVEWALLGFPSRTDSPAALTLRVLPSPNVSHGSSFSVECGAEGVPTPTFGWALPPAPNLRFGADNRSVEVENAAAVNRGRYTCMAVNRHGRRVGSVVVSVDESRLSLLLSLSLLGSVTVLAAAAWGIYYMKTTACKKGEYNVRDAEGSSEASRLHRGDSGGQRELFGIPLTPT
ncbi:intercellular adhesion molecule 5 isoform X3 [Lagopus muta]|uniref:intercellular adhesion molecule 5 isoform X3 n=1 Tax=Lagopus muta TaxID=64668 RepID=UPI0020A02A68|nr:intercellular adhesion molecule 5 isoform X3 [Lagopus muta]XP_048788880.1 intercellular adhesion molecule 5 isoform X3 [Lagopus muta]